jgi:hypothetical protein
MAAKAAIFIFKSAPPISEQVCCRDDMKQTGGGKTANLPAV